MYEAILETGLINNMYMTNNAAKKDSHRKVKSDFLNYESIIFLIT